MSFTMYAGDSKRIAVTITDEQGAALDISGAVFTWKIISADTEVDKDTASIGGISVTDAKNGVITIDVKPEDTAGMAGSVPYELRMTDANNNVSTVLRDKITIKASL